VNWRCASRKGKSQSFVPGGVCNLAWFPISGVPVTKDMSTLNRSGLVYTLAASVAVDQQATLGFLIL
jgi:hypothetical protein